MLLVSQFSPSISTSVANFSPLKFEWMHEYCCPQSFLAFYSQKKLISWFSTNVVCVEENKILQSKLCRYYVLWESFIFMEGVKKEKKIVRIYFCRRGYFSRANFYKFCFASAKARKSHPAEISFKVAQVYQRKTCFIWKRTVFRKSHLFVESRYNKSHLWWPQIHRAKRVWKTYNFIIWWDQNKIRVSV